MKKLWGGRFKKELAQDAKKLSYSLDLDKRLAFYDIKVNLAHTKALEKAKIITKSEFSKIKTNLAKLEKELSNNPKLFLDGDEDIHSLIERLLIKKIGDLGKKIHTGKSRNDQVLTDVRLFLKAELQNIIKLNQDLRKILVKLAKKHQDLIIPGFTHFQPAQPITLAHYYLAYYEKFTRDQSRLQECFKRTDTCPLGSGALAGNNFELDRNLVAKELGFSQITNNSLDAISERDFLIEFISIASIIMLHLSRLSEELILWSSPIIGFITIGDDYTTGSSIMPQKKNPDIAELIRGKTSRIYGHQITILTLLKATPLSYNRDFQEDKYPLFDTVDTLKDSLVCMTNLLSTVHFHQENIQKSLEKGHLLATELADYLVKKGLPFRTAHEITGKIVQEADNQKKQLWELPLAVLQKYHPKIQPDILEYLTFQSAIKSKNVQGGTAPNQIKKQIIKIEKKFQIA